MTFDEPVFERMEQAVCPECGHVELAADSLSAGMLLSAHRAEKHETPEQVRRRKAVARNPEGWYND